MENCEKVKFLTTSLRHEDTVYIEIVQYYKTPLYQRLRIWEKQKGQIKINYVITLRRWHQTKKIGANSQGLDLHKCWWTLVAGKWTVFEYLQQWGTDRSMYGQRLSYNIYKTKNIFWDTKNTNKFYRQELVCLIYYAYIFKVCSVQYCAVWNTVQCAVWICPVCRVCPYKNTA